MVGKIVKKTRCDDALSCLASSGRAVFFTLTTADVVDLQEIRARWRGLRHWLCRRLKSPHYVMNYELHPLGHGWHIHSVWNCFIPLREFRSKISEFGFGRCDVRRVSRKGLGEYLTKHAMKAYRGISIKSSVDGSPVRLRLVNTSRGLPRLSDYTWISPFDDASRALIRDVLPPLSDETKAICHRLGISCRRRISSEKFRFYKCLCAIYQQFGVSTFERGQVALRNSLLQYEKKNDTMVS